MKLATKLKISFAVLILVSVCLMAGTIVGLTSFKLYELKNSYDADASYQTLINPAELIPKICASEYSDLKSAAEEGGDLLDEDFLKSINKRLNKKSAFLVVLYDKTAYYSGNDAADAVLSQLRTIEYTPDSDTGIYIGGEYQVIVQSISFSMDDKEGVAFVVMQLTELIPQMKMLIFDGIIGIFIVLLITSAFFTAWIHRATVKPINKLRLATRNIKDGNLDFDVNVRGKDEIADLCRDFDDMRQRLKENADDKIKNEENNRILIRNISHDLKTPLTTIKGYSEAIMDGVVDNPEKLAKYVRTIYTKACDMDRLIDELTLYSKIDANEMPYNFIQLDVTKYFDDAAEDLKAELESEGFSFTYENRLSGGEQIVADPEQFNRVINNIISNSVKYMDKDNPMLALKLTDEDEWVHIIIEDNGAGIAEADVEHIFDRFYRADASRNQRIGGSGIGLSIVKKIVEDHGGTIYAESAEGEGTQIHIKMLRVDPEEPCAGRIE